MHALCASRLRETFYLIDPDRLFERALSSVAVGMEREHERSSDPNWLVERVDQAIQRLLDRDREGERTGVPSESPQEHFGLFVTGFFVEPELARAASVAFNSLPEIIRKSCQRLLIEGLTVDE